MTMDGYEYERKVLWPKWNMESAEQIARVKAQSANTEIDDFTKKRAKELFGIDLKEQPDLSKLGEKIFGNPASFHPELSPDYELFKSTKRSKYV